MSKESESVEMSNMSPDTAQSASINIAESAPGGIMNSAMTTKAEKAFIVVAGILILVGAALFIYGNQAVGIGVAGVINKLCGSLGMALASIGAMERGSIGNGHRLAESVNAGIRIRSIVFIYKTTLALPGNPVQERILNL